ncbi:MAG TPA: extracellular solute-binding protein, partial [Usitatibacter sp.]|nr:extracellular solute-binding protein [Usitatibacter sp.]
MQHRAWGLAALAAAVVAALPAAAQETTPAMVAAAEKEGKIVWYNSVDVKVAEAIARAFKEKYPKIDVQVERTGSERVLQRVNQEMQAGIKNADVVNSSDASHFIFWKKQGWLAKHTPPDTLKFDAKYRDAEGYYQTWRASLDCGGYNTNLVKDSDAPKSYKDLLDPKWKGKLAKAHPGYSGTALTGTFAITKVLGWDYLAQLARQGVL